MSLSQRRRMWTMTASPSLALALYFILNLTVTIFNKVLLQTPCPFALTGIHATATATACFAWQPTAITSLKRSTFLKLLLFSLLYTVNIEISNASLGLVTLPLHQAIRATGPVLTVIVSRAIDRQREHSYDFTNYLTLVLIVLGAAVTTWGGHYDATTWGLFLTLLGAFLAVLKTILTNQFLTKSHLGMGMSPIEMLGTLTPLAAIQAFLCSYLTGEYVVIFSTRTQMEWWPLAIPVLANAILAALLNITSFEASKHCRPLSIAIAANLKQVSTLVLPLHGVLPNVPVVVGTLLTVCGSIWYARAREAEGRKEEEEEEGLEK